MTRFGRFGLLAMLLAGGCYQASSIAPCSLTCEDNECPGGLECGDNRICKAPETTDCPLGPFGPPVRVENLSAGTEWPSQPSFTADRLELLFRRGTHPNGNLFVSRRATIADPWGPPMPIADLNTSAHEAGPGVSPDGLSLWFSSNRVGGLGQDDIWESTRPDRSANWSAPTAIPILNSASFDLSPAVSADGAVIVFNSGPLGATKLFAALRMMPTTWMSPQAIAELNMPPNVGNGRMWGSRLHIVFTADRAGAVGAFDLWMAERPTAADRFGVPVPLVELNTPSEDREPWISEDGRHLMFVSKRLGNDEIYEASR